MSMAQNAHFPPDVGFLVCITNSIFLTPHFLVMDATFTIRIPHFGNFLVEFRV